MFGTEKHKRLILLPRGDEPTRNISALFSPKGHDEGKGAVVTDVVRKAIVVDPVIIQTLTQIRESESDQFLRDLNDPIRQLYDFAKDYQDLCDGIAKTDGVPWDQHYHNIVSERKTYMVETLMLNIVQKVQVIMEKHSSSDQEEILKRLRALDTMLNRLGPSIKEDTKT
ncbi:hypothetical protein PG994_014137 [Apiospora phragmitis]|uniref:Uncharacterized protein n=1 Tax=Apiospora phragmitis TaxID=2905665 RepID=A0ABR1T3E5_9PEZI